MKLANPIATNLIDKNKDIAYNATKQMLDKGDLDAWECLVENAERLFPFVKENIAKNFSNLVNKNNYTNLLKLFKIYSFDFDDYFAQILSDLAETNPEISVSMLDLLANGTDDEKAYASKFFAYTHDKKAAYYLFKAYSINFEPLKYNSAKALGEIKDEYSYNYFINKLKAEDDWEKTDAVQFLQSYGDKKVFPLLLEAMNTSNMPEHIAGHIALLENISEYFNSNENNITELSLDCLQNLIVSEAEIWPLSTIIDFKIFECLDKLINLLKADFKSSYSGRYATLLLFAQYQFSMFLENNEYKFNEDKETINELEEIVGLLKSQSRDFWQNCKITLQYELNKNITKRVTFAIDVITELNLEEFVPELLDITNSQTDEVILYKATLCLSQFGKSAEINKADLLGRISDENLKASINAILV